MENYKEMYLILFKEISNTIDALKAVQLKVEEMYVFAGDDKKYGFLLKDDATINE